MRRLMIAAAMCVLALAPAAHAEMTMTVADALDLYQGLRSLDGYQQIVKDGQREQVVLLHYKLGAGLLMVIAKDIRALKPIAESADAARSAILMRLSKGLGKIDPNTPEASEFAVEYRALLAGKETVDLVKFDEAELGLQASSFNPIPATVLSQLMPVLILKPEPEKK